MTSSCYIMATHSGCPIIPIQHYINSTYYYIRQENQISAYFQSEIINSPFEASNKCFVPFCSAVNLAKFQTQLLLTQYSRCRCASHQTRSYADCINVTFCLHNNHNIIGTPLFSVPVIEYDEWAAEELRLCFRNGTIFSSKCSMAIEEMSLNSCRTSWALGGVSESLRLRSTRKISSITCKCYSTQKFEHLRGPKIFIRC